MAGEWINHTGKNVIEKNGRIRDTDCVDHDALVAFRDHKVLSAGLFHFIVKKCFKIDATDALWMAPPISEDKRIFTKLTRTTSSNSLYPTQVEGLLTNPEQSFKHRLFLFPLNPYTRWGLVVFIPRKGFFRCSSHDDEVNAHSLMRDLDEAALRQGETFTGETWSSFISEPSYAGLFCLVAITKILNNLQGNLKIAIEGDKYPVPFPSKPTKRKDPKRPTKPRAPDPSKKGEKWYAKALSRYEVSSKNFPAEEVKWEEACRQNELDFQQAQGEQIEQENLWRKNKSEFERTAQSGIGPKDCDALHELLLDGCLKEHLATDISDAICEKDPPSKIQIEDLVVGVQTMVRPHFSSDTSHPVDTVKTERPQLRVLLKSRMTHHPILPSDLIILQGDEITEDDAASNYYPTLQKEGEAQIAEDGGFETKSYIELKNSESKALQRCSKPTVIAWPKDTEDVPVVLKETIAVEKDGFFEHLATDISDAICEKDPPSKIQIEDLVVGVQTMVRPHFSSDTSHPVDTVKTERPQLRVLLKSRMTHHPILPSDLIILQGDEITEDDAASNYYPTLQKEGEAQIAEDGGFETKSYIELKNSESKALQRCSKPTVIAWPKDTEDVPVVLKETIAVEKDDLEVGTYRINLYPWPLGYQRHEYPHIEPVTHSKQEKLVYFELAAVYGNYRESCPCCGERRLPYHNIEIWESSSSKRICNRLSEALDEIDGLANESFMIGVMQFELDGRYHNYASNSGSTKARNDRVREAVQTYCRNFTYVPYRRYVQYDDERGTIAGIVPRNWLGYPVNVAKSKKSSKEPGNCVAPKILQQFYADFGGTREVFAKMRNLAMTEQWYEGKDRRTVIGMHGKTIPSCATCQTQVPYMLCDTRMNQ